MMIGTTPLKEKIRRMATPTLMRVLSCLDQSLSRNRLITSLYHLTSHACPTNMIKVAVSIHLKAIIQATGSSQLRDTRCKLHPFLFNHPSPPINEPDGNGHRGTPTVKLTTLVRPFKGGLNWIQQDTASWSRWYHPNSAAVELPPQKKIWTRLAIRKQTWEKWHMACRNREICLYSISGIGKKQNWSAIDCASQENQRTFQHLFFRISEYHLRYTYLNITNMDWVLLSSSLLQWVFQENFDLWFSSSFQRRFYASPFGHPNGWVHGVTWKNSGLNTSCYNHRRSNQHATPAVPRFYGELLKLWRPVTLANFYYLHSHRYKMLGGSRGIFLSNC